MDFVLLSIENMNLHMPIMPSPQFGRNFKFNVIKTNQNISEWNCEFDLCQMRIYIIIIIIIICHVSKSSLFHNIAKYPICRYFPCAMLGDSFDKMQGSA